ncbi:phage transcriptional regulator, ArpU family [Carnobacterium divergens]|nr:phage transcriptional regulator, ArpU family [Carnobacterium divergens]
MRKEQTFGTIEMETRFDNIPSIILSGDKMGEIIVDKETRKRVDQLLKKIPKLTAMARLAEQISGDTLLNSRLQSAKDELDSIKAVIASIPDEDQKEIITKRYLIQNNYETDIQVYMDLNMSESYYYRMKKEAFEILAFLWGL